MSNLKKKKQIFLFLAIIAQIRNDTGDKIGDCWKRAE